MKWLVKAIKVIENNLKMIVSTVLFLSAASLVGTMDMGAESLHDDNSLGFYIGWLIINVVGFIALDRWIYYEELSQQPPIIVEVESQVQQRVNDGTYCDNQYAKNGIKKDFTKTAIVVKS